MQHRTIAAALAAAAVLALAGCNSDSDKPAALPGGEGVDAVAQDAKAPAAVAVGQPITVTGDGQSVEMTAVKVVDPATTTSFSRVLGAGERLVAVQWRLAAPGTRAVSEYPAMQSKLIDDQGQRYGADPARVVSAGPAFVDGAAIEPGGNALGYVAYIVPATAKITKITLAPGMGLAQNTGTWTL